jgi:1-acyl-sn-glycerol-3-phosphate acyltransferase
MQPCRFVAKSDIRSWPFIGWLCAKTGTIFISRGKASDVRRIFKGIVESIAAGDRVAFFPEGTTAAQGKLLPFHANLFEAALDAKVPVQPYALRYLDAQGNYHSAADFIGDTTIVESILAVLQAGAITAELTQLPSIPTEGAHRRELAVAARKVVADGLGYVPEDLNPASGSADNPPGTAPDPQAAPQ